MKKIVYSPITKFVALCLMLVCAFQTVSLVTTCMIEYFGSEKEIYRFESTFEDSSYMSSYLDEVSRLAYHGFMTYYHDNPDKKSIVELVSESLNDVSEFSDYIVVINEIRLTNDDSLTEDIIMSRHFNSRFCREENGDSSYTATGRYPHWYYWENLDDSREESVKIYNSLDEDFVEESKIIWTEQRNLVLTTFSSCMGLILAFIVLLIYLICTCGKRADGKFSEMWLDKIPVEIHLAFMVLFFGLGLGIAFIVFDEFFMGDFPGYMLKTIIPASSTLAILLIVTSLLSLIRKIKCGTFLKTSITFWILSFSFKLFKKTASILFKASKVILSFILEAVKKLSSAAAKATGSICRALFRKTTLILVFLMTAYSALLIFLFIVCMENELGFVLLIMLFALGVVFVAYRAKDFENISKGAMEIRNGNLSYVIDAPKSDDMKKLAVNINEIAKGLDESVSAKMRAERLKTELITNVSHDLKTPLTSIINYAQLLSELDDLPEQAKDYVSIISRKSDRLKTLTQDLFDISKVQSGNESVVREKLDISLLINQSLGENDSEIETGGISFVADMEKELYIFADGRKMSRVITNLISNILKYSMKGTRAFITSKRIDGKAQIEFKNISSYIMDFDSEEITARFVRGDKSRSEEGSGLGLAIAKGYTEACGGSFDVIIDGDLFKVVMKFDLYE